MIVRLGLAIVALLAAAQAAAQPADPLRISLEALQALDTRVQSVGWRLVRGNAAYCRDLAPGIGLQLFDAAGFDDPAAVRKALGFTRDIAVEAVAEGSPAARAGLGGHQELDAVAGRNGAALPAAKPGDYARLAGLHDALDAQLKQTGAAEIAPAGWPPLRIAGEPVCVTRFEMLSEGSRASADGKRVVIGRKLVEELGDDALLAAALAHELAHNLLDHRARLDREGRSWGKVRATEREADRLSPWLLANAGYDPQAAVRFFGIWGPKHDLGLLATPDHDGWKERARRITAEIAGLEKARAARGGAADWARDFTIAGPGVTNPR